MTPGGPAPTPGSVRSKDGTPIAWVRSGEGPAVVLVHGTSADHTRWDPVLARLAARFTLYAVDRRGRGESGDTEPYALEREFEDLAAVVDAVGRPAALLGHSLGALCALEAARLTRNLTRMVLYEPPLRRVPPELVQRLQELVEAGDRAGAVTAFQREIVRVSPRELELRRRQPSWTGRVAAAHTIPRELVALGRYAFDPARFHGLAVPTLLLLGGESPPHRRAAVEAIDAALPDSRIAVLPGQQHAAMDTAPEPFAAETIGFLEAG